MPIDKGIYFITNVESSHQAFLSDGEKNTTIVARSNEDFSCSQWNVIPQRGNRFHIQSLRYPASYVWCSAFPRQGENVVGHDSTQVKEWVIRETMEAGLYTISPSDNEDLFWGLDNQLVDTPVELKKGQNLSRHHWKFHREPQVVENITKDLQLCFEWMDITTTPFVGRISGKLQRSDLPLDASISFPKSLQVVWNNFIVAVADMRATYCKPQFQADKNATNVLLKPCEDQDIISAFFKAVLMEESAYVELSVDEVTVTAGGERYESIGTSFRKKIGFQGLSCFKDQVDVNSIKITGSDPGGSSLTATCYIEIRNLSNISMLIDDLPVEIYYGGAKIGDLIVPSFKLQRRSTGSAFRTDVTVRFKPDDPKDRECKMFIAKYITTKENLSVSLSLTGTVVKLASAGVSIPKFSVDSQVKGIDKQFVKSAIGFISLVRAPLKETIDFEFFFENPIPTTLNIEYIKGHVKRGGQLLCEFEKKINMSVMATATMSSGKIRKAHLSLSRVEMVRFIGKTNLTLQVNVERATVSIGKFTLPELAFVLNDVAAKYVLDVPAIKLILLNVIP